MSHEFYPAIFHRGGLSLLDRCCKPHAGIRQKLCNGRWSCTTYFTVSTPSCQSATVAPSALDPRYGAGLRLRRRPSIVVVAVGENLRACTFRHPLQFTCKAKQYHACLCVCCHDRSVPLPLPVFYNLDDALSMSCLYHETLLSCIVQLLSSTSDLFRANFFFI
jgi:hypothetical protein